MNIGAPWPTAEQAEARVLEIQTKLHRWATDAPDRRFADLFNLVCDPAVLLVAWRRVRGNKGARTAGVDGQTVYYIQQRRGEAVFLAELRAELKARRFAPCPRGAADPQARQRQAADAWDPDRAGPRVQAALKLVLERSSRRTSCRARTAFAPAAAPRRHRRDPRVRQSTTRLQWVVEGDIQASLTRSPLPMGVRQRIADKRPGAGQGVPQGRHPQPGWRRRDLPAPHKAASCRHCWPTSP